MFYRSPTQLVAVSFTPGLLASIYTRLIRTRYYRVLFTGSLVSRRFLSGNGVTPSVGKIKSRCPEKNTNPRRRYVASTQEARFRARNRNLFTVLPCIQYFNYSGKVSFCLCPHSTKLFPSLSHTLLHNKRSHLHMFRSLKRSLSLKAYSKLWVCFRSLCVYIKCHWKSLPSFFIILGTHGCNNRFFQLPPRLVVVEPLLGIA